MKTIRLILTALFLPTFAASAMDRLEALSRIESQDNDRAIGPQWEVSRFQILPALWDQARNWSKDANGVWNPVDPTIARGVVNRIMQARCRAFEARYRREPNNFEYYILWHRPACFIGRPNPRRITSAEIDRGRRFANLCENRNYAYAKND
jgi:hypothetical protein